MIIKHKNDTFIDIFCMSKHIIYSLLLLLLFPLALSAKPKQKVWVIDAGHGGNDHGCETVNAMEKDINLKLAKRVAELVRANIPGVKVILTREYDRYLTLDQRCVIANSNNADLFLSIHVNAAPEVTTLRGTETFYGPQGGTDNKDLERKRKKNIQKSELLAWMMQKYYGLAGRPISRGVKRERYYVVLYTEMPAILTEVGFISTPSEERYMTSKEGSEEIAQCIYRGLKDYNETVDNDKIQSTLAVLRNTGGRTNQNVIPQGKGPEQLTNDMAKVDEKVEEKTTEKTVTKVEDNNVAKTEIKADEKNVAKADVKTDVKADTKKDIAVTINKESNESMDSVLVNTEEPEELDDPLLFSVQIFSLRAKLKPTDPRFKGLTDLLVVEREGLYKYLCGTTKDYAGARKLLAKVRETFPDAFLVAYKGNMQIPMSDAIEMLPK